MVAIGKYLSSEFKVNKCLRQGDEIFRLLSNIVLETGFIRSKVEIRGTTFDKYSQIMAYGNDIMGRGLKNIEELLKSPVGQTNYMGLEINEKKDKMCDSRALQ